MAPRAHRRRCVVHYTTPLGNRRVDTAVADLFITLFDAVSADPERAGHGWEGYYFAENGHSSFYDIAKAIGRVLVELGIIADPEPTPFTADELVKYWGSEVRFSYAQHHVHTL